MTFSQRLSAGIKSEAKKTGQNSRIHLSSLPHSHMEPPVNWREEDAGIPGGNEENVQAPERKSPKNKPDPPRMCVLLIDSTASCVEGDCLQVEDFHPADFVLRLEPASLPFLSLMCCHCCCCCFLRHKTVMETKVHQKVQEEFTLNLLTILPLFVFLFSFFSPEAGSIGSFRPKTVTRSKRYFLCASAGISSCLWPDLHWVSNDNGELIS